LASAFGIVGWAGTAAAQDLPVTHLKVVGLQSHLNSFKTGEKPFWEEHLPKASGGKVTAQLTAQDIHGLKGTEILRLMKLGVIDFSSGVISYMSGDTPAFEGIDLAGVTPDMATTRKAADAYRPVLTKIMEKDYGAKLLMLFPSPPQVLWCRKEVKNGDDLKGLRVRVFNKSMSDLVSGFGAAPVSMPFGEVTPALERGAIDCAVTGTLSGNTNKLHEVTNTMFTLYAGWAMHFHAVSLASWNKLDPRVRGFLEKEIAAFNERLWSVVAEEELDGINCSIGRGECKYGFKGKMTLVEPSAADLTKAKGIVANVILGDWAKRCGKACVGEWNDSIGKVLNISLPN
jgi:TRAP-type C4-dicarboxylate transport system substrate-binding protein